MADNQTKLDPTEAAGFAGNTDINAANPDTPTIEVPLKTQAFYKDNTFMYGVIGFVVIVLAFLLLR